MTIFKSPFQPKLLGGFMITELLSLNSVSEIIKFELYRFFTLLLCHPGGTAEIGEELKKHKKKEERKKNSWWLHLWSCNDCRSLNEDGKFYFLDKLQDREDQTVYEQWVSLDQ